MSIASEITRLQNAKADIKTAIEAKGVTVPSNAKLDDYDTYVGQIQTGGGGGPNSLTQLTGGNSNVDIPVTDLTGITTITPYAFYRELGLRSIVLPNTVTSIGEYAFQPSVNVTTTGGLASVTMPGVTSIGEYAFRFCGRLTSIDLSNVTSIGINAFQDCTSLSTVNFPTSSFTLSNSVFQNCPISSIDLTNCTSLGSTVFKGNTALTSVTIPNTLTSIGTGVFDSNTALTTVT